MTLRRSLASAVYATVAATGFCAQPSAPSAGDNLNLRYANGIVAVAEDKIITVADVSREITPLLPGLQRENIRNEARMGWLHDRRSPGREGPAGGVRVG